MRKITVNYRRGDNRYIPPQPPMITRAEPHVRWWNRPLGEHYTVGDSLACAAIFLTLFALMLAVWASN